MLHQSCSHYGFIIVNCVCPAGSGYGHTLSSTSPRVTRLFTVLNLFAHTEEILHSIYTKSVQSWLEEFPTYSVEHHAEFAKVSEMRALNKIIKQQNVVK